MLAEEIFRVKPRQKRKLEQDLNLIMKWFAGYFDNREQVTEEKAKNTEPELIHEQIHGIFAPVEIPAFGENVLYVKQYMDDDPTQIYRQRIYSFHVNEKEEAIELRIYAFLDDEAYIDAHLEPGKLSELTPEKMTFKQGCELYWQRKGNHFIGYMKEGTCQVCSQKTGKIITITDDCYLDREQLWIRDRAFDEDGNYVFGHKGNIHHKMKKQYQILPT